MSLRKGWDIDEFLHSLKYKRDVRNDLESLRRGQFRRAWGKALEGQTLTPRTLKKLTWYNLGNRAGRHFGSASPSEVEALLDELEVRYQRAKKG